MTWNALPDRKQSRDAIPIATRSYNFDHLLDGGQVVHASGANQRAS